MIKKGVTVEQVARVTQSFTQAGIMEFVSSGGNSKRQRTLALLGICATLIPMHICKNNKWNETMRGMIFPIMVYMGSWIFYYKDTLFTF